MAGQSTARWRTIAVIAAATATVAACSSPAASESGAPPSPYQALSQALAEANYDPTTPQAGYGSVQGFAQQECAMMQDLVKQGVPVSAAAENLAGVTQMPRPAADKIISTITSTGLCNV